MAARSLLRLALMIAAAASLPTAGCEKPFPSRFVSKKSEARMTLNERHNLALEKVSEGLYEECERVLENVVKRKKMVQAFANLAFCQSMQDSSGRRQALDTYLEAFAVDAEAPPARLGRGLLLVELGRGEDAAEDLAALRAMASPLAEVLSRSMDSGRVTPEARKQALYGPIVTPRRSPRGIMGD